MDILPIRKSYLLTCQVKVSYNCPNTAWAKPSTTQLKRIQLAKLTILSVSASNQSTLATSKTETFRKGLSFTTPRAGSTCSLCKLHRIMKWGTSVVCWEKHLLAHILWRYQTWNLSMSQPMPCKMKLAPTVWAGRPCCRK